MLSATRLLVLLLCMFLPWSAQAQFFSQSSSSNFLPVHEAFVPSTWHDGNQVYIGFENADGYYLYRHQFGVTSSTGDDILGEPKLPAGEEKTDEFFGNVRVFYDQMVFTVPFTTPQQGPVEIQLTYQGCADAGLCYPPETIELTAAETSPPPQFAADAQQLAATDSDAHRQPATSEGSSATGSDSEAASKVPAPTVSGSAPVSEDSRFKALIQDAGLPVMLGLFFLAGLGLTFTPCVLPMIPILSSIIVGQSSVNQNPGRRHALALSASYVAGMALTYAAVGVLMGLFGAGLNLQARLQSAPVLITFSILFGLFALAMFGVFNLQLSPRLNNLVDGWQQRAQRSGPLGLAVAGALSVLVVSPCVSAPLAGALVFISTTGDAMVGGAALLALALGMGVPLLLVGTFGTTLLPRSGNWMNGVKVAFGILLLGVSVWLIERLLPGPVALLLWAGLAVGTGLTLGAINLQATPGWPRVRQTAGVMLLVWGIALVVGATRGAEDPLRPLAGAQFSGVPAGAAQSTAHADVTVVHRLDELQQLLASSTQPAFVNITAEWCISCKIMEREVFPDARVQQALADYRWIDVDVTESNANSREVLEHLRLFGPPSLLFFNGNNEIREARIQGELEADELAQHARGVSQWLSAHAEPQT
ncbi:thiol:disulfide interchange protein DsbD [Halomonas cupida]|uniref:Thiol:disulfide interchange protein DsbD n=1 Tax=Halomonas cupida TaxID=44933 RepID=A0A1M7HTY2_9GAMM|nr:protein-disulfide reductase DsbD [Halomonas cupida]GEN23896.1 thiol:disulfide interchange protein DsbD [Halomonas cupida]SHM32002.1 thiol:disulfide interchange protein DsbD [Halomonas cupida]